MSSIRGTTRSGSSSSRDRKAPSTEPAFAALAGPVTSVRGKRSNVGSGADGKVAPRSPRLTRSALLDQAFDCCVRKYLLVALFGQHDGGVLQLPADAGAGPEDPAREPDEAFSHSLEPQLLAHVPRAAAAHARVVAGVAHPLRQVELHEPAPARLVQQL